MKTNTIVQIYLDSLSISSFSSRIEFILKKSEASQKVCVQFALMCANDSLQWIDQIKNKKIYDVCVDCIAITNMWLNDPKSVSSKELTDAADVAHAAAHAANAAYAAAHAAKQQEYTLYLLELLGCESKLLMLVV